MHDIFLMEKKKKEHPCANLSVFATANKSGKRKAAKSDAVQSAQAKDRMANVTTVPQRTAGFWIFFF